MTQNSSFPRTIIPLLKTTRAALSALSAPAFYVPYTGNGAFGELHIKVAPPPGSTPDTIVSFTPAFTIETLPSGREDILVASGNVMLPFGRGYRYDADANHETVCVLDALDLLMLRRQIDKSLAAFATQSPVAKEAMDDLLAVNADDDESDSWFQDMVLLNDRLNGIIKISA